MFAFAFRLVQFYNFYVSAITWKNVLKCVILEQCHTLLRLIKHRHLVYLGKDCGFTAQYLCNSLEKETHCELRFRGGGGGQQFSLVSPFPDQSKEKSWQIWMIEYHKDSPATSRKPKIASWATYIFNQNFIVSPNYKRRHPRKWIRIFPFLFKMFSLNPIRAGGPC